MAIFNVNKDLLGEVYDIFSYSLTFIRFLGNKKVENITQELLNINKTSSLYGSANRMRIDPPSDERRTYGWHQEIFYTFPDTKFLQTWCPMMRDTSIENGTIKITIKTKVACCQDENFKSDLDRSIPYDCHAPLIDTCVCMQSACPRATIVSLLLINFSLIPT